MLNTNPNHEYTYTNSESGHHHHYLLPPLLKVLNNLKNKRITKPQILDIGCGNGSLSALVAQQGYEVVGIEDSQSAVAIANKNFPQCNFMQANVYDLPYDELGGDFDVVISTEVIEHLLYPRELIKSAKKCLKPNGTLILTTPYHGYLKNLMLALTGKMDDHFTATWDGGHIKFFSVKTLQLLLQEENFTDFQFQFAGRLPYLWKSMIVSSTL
jgi:2-polyprenyl-3-methyl-5-hydroxy-6-metoxy-1,4-benzoquinol methylase